MGNYWDIVSNSTPIMIACMFEVIIENINMHFATNKEMMAGIGMANILVHCVGGSLIKGFVTGFTGLASRAFGAKNKDFLWGFMNMLKVDNPFQEYKTFVLQCFYVAFPYFLNFSILQCMTLYLGSFRLNNQTVANVALTNLSGIITSPHTGYSIYLFTKIGHFIGENQPEKLKSLIKQTMILSQITYYALLFLVFIFRWQVGSYYFKDHDVFKYFFIGINFLYFVEFSKDSKQIAILFFEPLELEVN